MRRDHGFHKIRITRVIQETADTRSYALGAPFPYRAGQFVTFRVCGTLRSYSMSSCPDTDDELLTTVKRVPGGLVSNWMHDNLAAGDVVEMTAPAGIFCLDETDAPLIAFAGGSGVTPIMSLAKSALAATHRRVRILTANRDAESVIFAGALDELAARYPGRLDRRHHLDVDGGYLTPAEVLDFVGGDRDAAFYLCGPEPFMDVVEAALLGHGVAAERIRAERFGPAAEPAAATSAVAGPDSDAGIDPVIDPAGTAGEITIILDGERRTVPRFPGETLLESARRAGLDPPSSCEAGNCATCIAQISDGEIRMRANNALDDDELADGWVLTCQSEPVTPNVTVRYDD